MECLLTSFGLDEFAGVEGEGVKLEQVGGIRASAGSDAKKSWPEVYPLTSLLLFPSSNVQCFLSPTLNCTCNKTQQFNMVASSSASNERLAIAFLTFRSTIDPFVKRKELT